MAVEIIFEGKAPWVVTEDDSDKCGGSQTLKGWPSVRMPQS